MAAAGFTMAFNQILRDKNLSLSAKGLYLVIASFTGMPDWKLTKGQLARYCESSYALEKAWRGLQAAGYLKHRFFQVNGSGAFVHVYDLLQHPDDTPAYQYSSPSDRPNGDCRIVRSSDTPRDFTRIPNTVLRSTVIPLAVKGLFAVVAHLTNIPDFYLHPEGVRAFCVERLKRFSTVWRDLKLSGLLKQHRYPTGEDNGFTYRYDLRQEPDNDTPYLTNYHADGSVSSARTIAEFLDRARKKLKVIRAAASVKKPQRNTSNVTAHQFPLTEKSAYAPSEAEREAVRSRIDYPRLQHKHDPALVDLITDALAVLSNAPKLTVSKRDVPQAKRAELAGSVSYDDISRFIRTTKIDLTNAKNPAAYLRTVLYTWLQQHISAQDSPRQNDSCQTPQPPLSDWELDWLNTLRETRKRRLAAQAAEQAEKIKSTT